MGYQPKRVVALWLALFVAAPVLPASDKNDPDQIGKRNVGKGINFYSMQKEVALGKTMAEDVERDSKLLDDPVVTEYVNRIGQNLVRNSDATVPFTIKVIDSDEVNAFALPGGFFFVNSGLILKADSEAELAGVMAHEIAHVAARHGTRQATRGHLINYGSIPLIFMGGWAGYAVRQVAQIAIPLGFLQFSRGFEREADMLGLQYLYKTGYDPLSFVDFFEKIQAMEKKEPGTVASVFSSHPMTSKRIRAAQKEIQKDLKPQPQYVVDTSEFQSVKARLEAIQNRRKAAFKDMNGPILRRSKASGTTVDGEDEGRPTLKRR